ncbi:MAG TPA: TetR/AcrR family transcriptional regulator [Devosia sp.]|nr:TetR/AcrR family transcriptional regulator [Devosia sp.]
MNVTSSEFLPTPRQGEVLDAALQLLVRAGDRLTMSAVAQQASCSKETLYNWFGDREGLLTAIVKWQASKVGMPVVDAGRLNAKTLRQSIESFGRNLLGVLSGDISVALNRVAISHAGSESANLGDIVLENGRFAMGRRLKPILEEGRNSGLLAFEDTEEAFRTFFGLLMRDTQIRLLLGEKFPLGARGIEREAARATEQFISLYGT